MKAPVAGKVALVTGGARGIGAAACRELAKLGAEVAVTDVLDDEGKALADELGQAGHRAFYQHLDVADEDSWSDNVAEVIARSGRLDVLVNNAESALRGRRGSNARRVPAGDRRNQVGSGSA